MTAAKSIKNIAEGKRRIINNKAEDGSVFKCINYEAYFRIRRNLIWISTSRVYFSRVRMVSVGREGS